MAISWPGSPTANVTTHTVGNRTWLWDGTSWGLTTQSGSAVLASTANAKGDVLVGTANDTVSVLSVGTDGQVLVADSSQASGLRWTSSQDTAPSVISTVGALPVASASNRGQLRIVTDAGVADRLFVSRLLADGTSYDWIEL